MPKCPDCNVRTKQTVKVFQNHLIGTNTCPKCGKIVSKDDFGEMP